MKLSTSNIIVVIAISCIAALSTASCKKLFGPKPKSTDSLPVSFYSNTEKCVLYPGNPVSFGPSSTNVPGGTTFHWSFGDGDTSSQEFPVHTYFVGGTYTVILAFNGSAAHAIDRSIYITPVNGTHYTQLLGAERHWVGNGANGGGVSYSLDTTLMVAVVDSGTVTFPYAHGLLYLYDVDTLIKNRDRKSVV